MHELERDNSDHLSGYVLLVFILLTCLRSNGVVWKKFSALRTASTLPKLFFYVIMKFFENNFYYWFHFFFLLSMVANSNSHHKNFQGS